MKLTTAQLTTAQRLKAAEQTLMAIACYGAIVNDEPESRACARNWLDTHASRQTRKEIAEILSETRGICVEHSETQVRIYGDCARSR